MKSNYRFLLTTGLLSTILLASIALNCYLFSRGQQYYLQLNETRLDPLGLSYYITNSNQQSLLSPGQTTVVLFGDSRAAAWPSPPNLREFEFVNRGIGAQTSAQVAQRFDYHVRPLQPQIIVVQVGINDLKTIPLFPERQEAIIAGCKENIQQIVTRSTDLGATVILTTIFPIGKVPIERRLFWSGDVALSADEVNAYIRSLESDNVIIFDSYSILADGRGITRSEYSRDCLHINATGYEALNYELAHILTALE
jgi:lysophospholipase L1-like esterase